MKFRFLQKKKIIVFKTINKKFNNEKRTQRYENFNILKVSIRIFKLNFTKDSYDKTINPS